MEGGGFGRPAQRLVIAAVLIAVCSLAGRAASRSTPEIGSVLDRVGERIAGYYSRAQSLVCIETSTVQPIHTNWSVDGFARTVESELRIEANATTRREIRRVNGRQPRKRDEKDRAGCTDPDVLSQEPLAFLLPEGRAAFDFTGVREGRDGDRPAFVIDFVSVNRKSKAELIEDPRGHDDCFDWSGPIARRGQIWVDATSYDVLRVERYNTGPVDLRIPWAMQRRYNFDAFVTLDRDDLTLRYQNVSFSDPDEVVVLPTSIVSLTVVRTGLQSTRRTVTFSDYRRFLTSGRIR